MVISSARPIPRSPVSPEEVAETRRPTLQASTLPARVHLDPEVFAYEMAAWFRATWLVVGREEDVPQPGSFFRTSLCGENVIVARGDDNQIRAFHNVCRHRGATIVQEDAGRVGGFSCPYHAWTYDLQGRLRMPRHLERVEGFACEENSLIGVSTETLAGFIFLNLAPEPRPFADFAGDLGRHLERFRLHELRRASRRLYDVHANWKVFSENSLECYHCPGVHPLLTKLTPPGLGGSVASSRDWSVSWMELGNGVETMSIDGRLNDRPIIPALQPEDLHRVYYVWIWPNLLFSINPDYVRALQHWPVEAGRSRIVYDVYFHEDAIARPGFDPSGPVDFADLIVREDLSVCELQQQGITSSAYIPGRYAQIEGATHRFDARVADLYANDGRTTNIDRAGDYYRMPSAGS